MNKDKAASSELMGYFNAAICLNSNAEYHRIFLSIPPITERIKRLFFNITVFGGPDRWCLL